MSAPHIQRCVEQRRFGTGVHARPWQCRLADPHPGERHDFGADAEVYGRDLDAQRPEWLAAQLRKAAAQAAYQQRRIDELSAIAAQLADLAARGVPVSDDAAKWVTANRPDAALNLAPRRWYVGWTRR